MKRVNGRQAKVWRAFSFAAARLPPWSNVALGWWVLYSKITSSEPSVGVDKLLGLCPSSWRYPPAPAGGFFVATEPLNWSVENADGYSAGPVTFNMTSKRPNSPNFAVLVIILSSAAVIVAGHTAYGITGFVALGLAYLVAISTPLLSRCAPLEPTSKLKRAIFLCAFIAIFLGVFIGRTYPSVPWPEDAASLSTAQVEALLRSYRTLLFGVCTIVAVAYLQIIRLLLHYLRDAGNATASISAQPGTVVAEKDLVRTASLLKP